MAWFNKDKSPKVPKDTKLRIPEGLWVKCNNCREVIYTKEMEKNFKVCPKCDYHFPISVEERIALILDDGSFKEWDRDLISMDPLNFRDTSRYRDRLRSSQEKTSFKEAVIVGQGTIQSRRVDFGVFNFNFMGGSMGSVVGEKILRATERATEYRHPLILVISSGGARMQEGILSLMQMAKTSAAIARLHEARVPLITILTDPTYGGVTASFAMLGDIIIAEPRSLIGFAGPRVIEETIKQQLPAGFQRAEFLMERGFIDLIVPRKQLKDTLAKLIAFF